MAHSLGHQEVGLDVWWVEGNLNNWLLTGFSDWDR